MNATIASEYMIGRNSGVLGDLREMTRTVIHDDHEVKCIGLREGTYTLFYRHGREYGDYSTANGGERVKVLLH